MALRGKRKRKKAKRGATPDTRNTIEGKHLCKKYKQRGTGQRSRRYRHKNKEGENTQNREINKQNPGTKQTANNAERGGGSDNHKRTHKKERFKKGTSKSLFNNSSVSLFNNSPVCVESQHTRTRVGARSVYRERKERKKKTRRARKKERKKKRKAERKKGIKKKEEI